MWMQGEREWLPSRSNCKGPARATVCSHSSRTGSSCIATLREYPFPPPVKIGRSLYGQLPDPWHLLLVKRRALVFKQPSRHRSF